MTSLAILNLFGRKIILDNFSTTQYYIKSSSKVKVGSERAIRKWGVLVKLKPITKIEIIMTKMRPMPNFPPSPMGAAVG